MLYYAILADDFRRLLNFKLLERPFLGNLRIMMKRLHDKHIVRHEERTSGHVAFRYSLCVCVCAYPKVVLGNTFMHHMLVSASFAALDGISINFDGRLLNCYG